MGRPRSELHTLLLSMNDNVYFQPPATVQMTYPAFVYKRDDIRVAHADNSPYRLTTRYELTVIDEDPDSSLVDDVSKLPLCDFNRHFAANNLNHDVFTLYF